MNNFQLIKEVAARRLLWDRIDGEVGDVGKREELWDEIAAKLKTSTYVVRTRWKNLRDSYRRLMTKQLETGEEPRWRYYKMMHFLRDVILSIKPRTLDISLPNLEKRTPLSILHAALKPEPCEDDMISYSDSNAIEADENGDFESLLGSFRKRKRSDDCEPEYIEVQASLEGENNVKIMRLSSNDEDLQFLLSLHPHLKGVPPHKKLPLRMKIEKVLYDEIYSKQSAEQEENENAQEGENS